MPDRTREIIQYLEREAEKFSAALGAAELNPRGKAVHELRVCSRKLRAVLGVAAPRRQNLRSLRRRLQRLAAAAGAERELEVAKRDAGRMGMKLKDLNQKESRAQHHLRSVIHRKKYRRLPSKIKQTLAELRAGGLRDRSGWHRQLRKLASWEGHLPASSKEFHLVRIALKKARYSLEALNRHPDVLSDIQKLLGRAHDFEVLEQMAGRKRRITRARRVLEGRAAAKLEQAFRTAKRGLAGN